MPFPPKTMLLTSTVLLALASSQALDANDKQLFMWNNTASPWSIRVAHSNALLNPVWIDDKQDRAMLGVKHSMDLHKTYTIPAGGKFYPKLNDLVQEVDQTWELKDDQGHAFTITFKTGAKESKTNEARADKVKDEIKTTGQGGVAIISAAGALGTIAPEVGGTVAVAAGVGTGLAVAGEGLAYAGMVLYDEVNTQRVLNVDVDGQDCNFAAMYDHKVSAATGDKKVLFSIVLQPPTSSWLIHLKNRLLNQQKQP